MEENNYKIMQELSTSYSFAFDTPIYVDSTTGIYDNPTGQKQDVYIALRNLDSKELPQEDDGRYTELGVSRIDLEYGLSRQNLSSVFDRKTIVFSNKGLFMINAFVDKNESMPVYLNQFIREYISKAVAEGIPNEDSYRIKLPYLKDDTEREVEVKRLDDGMTRFVDHELFLKDFKKHLIAANQAGSLIPTKEENMASSVDRVLASLI